MKQSSTSSSSILTLTDFSPYSSSDHHRVKVFPFPQPYYNSPNELSKVWMCSEVMNWDTRDVFPTWQSPIMQTRTFLRSSALSAPPPPLSLGELRVEEQTGDLKERRADGGKYG